MKASQISLLAQHKEMMKILEGEFHFKLHNLVQKYRGKAYPRARLSAGKQPAN